MWRPERAQRREHSAAGERRPPSGQRGGEPSGSRPVPGPGERARGRPRDPRADQAIVKATLELLAEVGYVKLTIEATAARAQVGKTTIYRRWKSKGLLVVDVLAGIIDLGPAVDTGDTRKDLLALLNAVVNILRDPLIGQSIPGLANDLPTDEELAAAFREQIIGPNLLRVTEIMARAAQRGEVSDDVDCAMVTDMLLGPVLWRSMLTEQPLNVDALGRIVDHVLAGIRTATPPPSKR